MEGVAWVIFSSVSPFLDSMEFCSSIVKRMQMTRLWYAQFYHLQFNLSVGDLKNKMCFVIPSLLNRVLDTKAVTNVYLLSRYLVKLWEKVLERRERSLPALRSIIMLVNHLTSLQVTQKEHIIKDTGGQLCKLHRRTALQVTQENQWSYTGGSTYKLHRMTHFPRYMGEPFYKLHQRPHFN